MIPSSPLRPAWVLVGLGAFVGALATAGVTTVFARRHAPAAVATAVTPFVVEPGAVRLRGQVPFHFETAAAEVGSPLPRTPVPARVTSREQLTSPTYAPLDGRVVEVAVRLGDEVKAGDRLVQVRSGDLATLERDAQAAQLAIRTKQALVDRLQLLVESRAAAQSDLLVARSELAEARLASQAASARLRSLSIRPSGDTGYWVMAPRAGTVVQLDAAPGRQVGPDRDHPVATIADLSELLVVADLPQRDAAVLDPGAPAQIRAPGAQAPIEGTIESISRILDPDRQTVPVRVRVPMGGQKSLRPQAFVEAVFSSAPGEQVVLVPTAAVVSDGATSVVFVETEPGVLRRRPVQLGRQASDRTEILSGLNGGERVVVRGALLLLNALDVRG